MIDENRSEGTLGDIFETVTGNTPSKKDKDNYGTEIPFIKPPQINNNYLKTSPEFLSAKGKMRQLFGNQMNEIINKLNEVLAA